MRAEQVATRCSVVLVVDNEARNRELIAARLELAGFVVYTAASGEEALAIAPTTRPDVIFSDLLMDDIDGFGLCRRVRADAALAGIPVVLVGSHCDEKQDHDLARDVGASALVARTPSFEDELRTLRRVLASNAPIPTATVPTYEQHLSRNASTLARLAHKVEVSEARWRTLFDNANESIAVLSPAGLILEVNRRTQEMHGRTAAELVGHYASEFATPGGEAVLREALRTLAAKGRHEVVLPITRKDGQEILVDYSARIINLDGETVVLTISRDVTESVRVARALAAAEERYRTLLDRIPDVVWVADESLAMTFVTPNSVRLTGFTPEEIVAGGQAFWAERVHPDDKPMVEQATFNLMVHGRLMDLELRLRHRNGTYMWMWSRMIGISRDGGRTQYEGVISDITEKRRLSEQLRMSQKMEAIGKLTSGIAHDFNNLLAVILANTSLLKDELGPNDPRQEGVEDIEGAASRGVALVRQLLAFSRKQVLQPRVVDLNEVVTGTKKMLHRLIGGDIDLRCVSRKLLTLIRADAGQIEQVVINLVVNARDAMPNGGRITIECGNVDLDSAFVADHVPMVAGTYAMLAVTDTGCGMDDETRKRVFEPFYTTKPIGKGTGLGLSSCYGIVKQSGGFIWVKSKIGEGTVFTVYFPTIDSQVAIAPVV